MSNDIPFKASKQVLLEALNLSEEIISDIELSRVPLAQIALKASRLARILDETVIQKIFSYEVSGYPTTPTGVPSDICELAKVADRNYQIKDIKTNKIKEYFYLQSIDELEAEYESLKMALQAAQDRDVSIASANPEQYVFSPLGNSAERKRLLDSISLVSRRKASRKGLLHRYSMKKYYELKFSGIASDIFERIRLLVDSKIGIHLQDSIQKLSSVYDNLLSDNSEDWSNAVHSCRRVIEDLADCVCPPREPHVVTLEGGKSRVVKLGKLNCINRIIYFIESKSSSETYKHIVSANIELVGTKIEAVFNATNKGTHTTILSREEADRYVVHTYLLVGDVLSLLPGSSVDQIT